MDISTEHPPADRTKGNQEIAESYLHACEAVHKSNLSVPLKIALIGEASRMLADDLRTVTAR
jgi:hypothetical protein